MTLHFKLLTIALLFFFHSSYAHGGKRFGGEKIEIELYQSRGNMMLSLHENNSLIFNYPIDSRNLLQKERKMPEFYLSPIAHHTIGYSKGYATFSYKKRGRSDLMINISQYGDIFLSGYKDDNGFEDQRSWILKTFGRIHHSGNSFFYKLETKANEFYNNGILKVGVANLDQSFLVNEKILHFGSVKAFNEEEYSFYGALLNQNKGKYSRSFNSDSSVLHQRSTIQDRGALIAESGLRIQNLSYHVNGVMKISGAPLRLEDASLHNNASIELEFPFEGKAIEVTNRGLWKVPVFSEKLSCQKFRNEGKFVFKDSCVVGSEGVVQTDYEKFVQSGIVKLNKKKSPSFVNNLEDFDKKLEKFFDKYRSPILLKKDHFFLEPHTNESVNSIGRKKVFDNSKEEVEKKKYRKLSLDRNLYQNPQEMGEKKGIDKNNERKTQSEKKNISKKRRTEEDLLIMNNAFFLHYFFDDNPSQSLDVPDLLKGTSIKQSSDLAGHKQ